MYSSTEGNGKCWFDLANSVFGWRSLSETQELSCIISGNMTLIVFVFIITFIFLGFCVSGWIAGVMKEFAFSERKMINCFFMMAQPAHTGDFEAQHKPNFYDRD